MSMTSTPETTDLCLSGLNVETEAFPELAPLRAKAAASHAHRGIPTTSDEEWKYTSLRALTESYFLLGSNKPVNPETIKRLSFEGLDQTLLVFVNGRFNAEASTDFDNDPACEIAIFSDGIPDWAALRIGSLVKNEESTFAALNTATFVDGVAIRFRANQQTQRPIHILNIAAEDPNDATSYSAPRMVVVAESGSQGTIVESNASTNIGPTFANPVAEIFVASNAHLEHVKLQRENEQATQIATTEVKQEADSTYLNFTITIGGKLIRNDLNVFLNGSNLHSRMDGVVLLNGQEHADNHTRLDHAFPHCDSFEVYKHVLSGKSTAVFNGKIYVHQDAQKTDAKQTNQTLLLSPEATMNAKPQLEIFADDVKCTHGATIGHLDVQPLFYLQARGIPKSQAEAMLVYAFAAEVVEKISNRDLVERIEALVHAKLDA